VRDAPEEYGFFTALGGPFETIELSQFRVSKTAFAATWVGPKKVADKPIRVDQIRVPVGLNGNARPRVSVDTGGARTMRGAEG
jgi:hypothetical protein